MRIKLFIILLGLMFFLQGCSHKIKTVAVATSTQKTFYDGSIISENRHAVTLSHYDKIELAKDRTIFEVILQNRGNSPVNFSKGDISVTFEGNEENRTSKKIIIQSADEFIKYLEDAYYNEEIRKITDIIRKVSRIADQAHETSIITNMSGGGSGGGSTGGGGNDKSIEMQALMLESNLITTVDKIKFMRKHIEQLKESIPDIIIKSKTIMPRGSYSGLVVCDTSEMTPETEGQFKIVVTLEGEKHEFTFERRT